MKYFINNLQRHNRLSNKCSSVQLNQKLKLQKLRLCFCLIILQLQFFHSFRFQIVNKFLYKSYCGRCGLGRLCSSQGHRGDSRGGLGLDKVDFQWSCTSCPSSDSAQVPPSPSPSPSLKMIAELDLDLDEGYLSWSCLRYTCFPSSATSTQCWRGGRQLLRGHSRTELRLGRGGLELKLPE